MPQRKPMLADIAVITDDWTNPLLEVQPPAGDRVVTLMRGLVLERLHNDEAEACIDACQERGRNHDSGTRSFSQLYSIARLHAPEEGPFTFDADGTVQLALQLSRMIVLNSHCTEWGVRVLRGYFRSGDESRLVPARCVRRFFAYRVITDERDWLTQNDAMALARLMRRHAEVKARLPERVTNGMWNAEWGARIPYFQPALVNTVTALEALLKTDRPKLTRQFVSRTCALAEELEIEGVTEKTASDLYDDRSGIAHGAFIPFEDGSPEALRLVPFQKLLMKALRRAIEDDVFCARFENAESIRDAWPVSLD